MLTTFTAIEDKPQELFPTALIRARFCELAGTPEDEDRADPSARSGIESL
jgi:hypothetical protein